jgi:hypothetical protein
MPFDTENKIMTDDQIIDQIIHSFSKYNLRDITEINNCTLDFTIAEFILCSCLIDQVSGFRYNTDSVGQRFKQFVKDYLPGYHPDELYQDLRNKLVHNYSVGEYYGLTRKAPKLHLQEENGIIHLNLENFIADLKTALDRYFAELRKSPDIKQNALRQYAVYKIIQ